MISSIFAEGLLYGIVALGVFSEFRILGFCDMTVDGSFPLGGAVLAASLISGVPPSLALFFAFCAGLCAGAVTATIHTFLKIPDLLSGILTMTMLYSVNLRVMGSRANISLLKIKTPFSFSLDFIKNLPFKIDSEWGVIFFLVIFVMILKFALDIFYHTDLGLLMGALGANERLVISQGVNPSFLRSIGICFGNGLASLSGAFCASYNGFSDVNTGSGIIVASLASIMLGEFIIKSNRISLQTFRVLAGSTLYRALMVLARNYGYKIKMTPNDLKLATGILIILCLAFSKSDFKNLKDFFKKKIFLKFRKKNSSAQDFAQKKSSVQTFAQNNFDAQDFAQNNFDAQTFAHENSKSANSKNLDFEIPKNPENLESTNPHNLESKNLTSPKNSENSKSANPKNPNLKKSKNPNGEKNDFS